MHTKLSDTDIEQFDGPYRTFARCGTKYVEEHESVEEALKAQYWGEETGQISATAVFDEDGDTVFDCSRDENIFGFCESREYGWVTEW